MEKRKNLNRVDRFFSDLLDHLSFRSKRTFTTPFPTILLLFTVTKNVVWATIHELQLGYSFFDGTSRGKMSLLLTLSPSN